MVQTLRAAVADAHEAIFNEESGKLNPRGMKGQMRVLASRCHIFSRVWGLAAQHS